MSNSDPDPITAIAAKVAVNLITEIFKGAAKGYNQFEAWLVGEPEKRDIFGFAARQYASRMEKRYGTMRVLGMREPVSLRSIYVRVNVLEKISADARSAQPVAAIQRGSGCAAPDVGHHTAYPTGRDLQRPGPRQEGAGVDPSKAR